MTSDGKPYAQERFKELVKERYIIAKHGNIAYEDTGKMTPVERTYITQFIQEDLQRQIDAINSQTQGRK